MRDRSVGARPVPETPILPFRPCVRSNQRSSSVEVGLGQPPVGNRHVDVVSGSPTGLLTLA